MKIAVITLKDSPNYGGILQAYALQCTLKKLGHDCDLIDYMNDAFRHKFTFFGRPEGMSTVYWLYKKLQYPFMVIMMRKMMPFYSRMDVTRHFQNPEDLAELNQEYDAFVTGSDQVWACDLNHYDDSYFLRFVDDEHLKLSYAASFGRTVDTITDREAAFIGPLLKKLDIISTRENSGVELVRKLTSRDDSISVLDPTFLLEKNEWNSVASHVHRGRAKRYILCYLMQSWKNDSEALQLAKRLSKERGIPVIKICRGLTSVLWGETVYIPTVEEWLGLFMDAEYVVTNSFHGMAFSVNFKKNFTVYVEGEPSSGRNSRIYDRCRDMGLENRICVAGSGKQADTGDINYAVVSHRLEKLKR